MMTMQVRLPNAAGVIALAERLRAAVEPERISVNGDGRQLDIRIEREADRRVLHVLEAVERWRHDRDEVGPVEMWLGERSYILTRWAPAETWQ